MKTDNIKNMVGGWFVGNFTPNVFKTTEFEVGLKEFKAGQVDNRHYHLHTKEITLVVAGQVSMNGFVYNKGDIIFVEKSEPIEFVAISDATVLAIKVPSNPTDKVYC